MIERPGVALDCLPHMIISTYDIPRYSRSELATPSRLVRNFRPRFLKEAAPATKTLASPCFGTGDRFTRSSLGVTMFFLP